MEREKKVEASKEMRKDVMATTPLKISVTTEAIEVLTWRTLARQTIPMLQRPEQFHVSQRSQLVRTICQLLDGELELEDAVSDIEDAYEPDCCDRIGKETW